MAKYDITFSCGHTETRNLVGKTKDRESKIEWLSGQLCTECWEEDKKRKFDEQNRKAAEEAREYGLPDLTGSEKQIAWANTLRQNWVTAAEKYLTQLNDNLQQYVEKYPEKENEFRQEVEAAKTAVDKILLDHHAAKHWIDHRNDDVKNTIVAEARKVLADNASSSVPEAIKKQALEDMTIRPEVPTTSLITEIHIKENFITARLPEKDDEFRTIVKSSGLSWTDGCWLRKIGLRTGTALDRAAELGIKLLAAGYSIRVFDDALQAKILAGEFEPESRRWIVKTDDNYFNIIWDREDDFYKAARNIPSAKWKSGVGMLVKKEAFREVMDFADKYKFSLSPGACELIEEAQAAFESSMVADVKIPQKERLPKPGSKPTKLKIEECSIDESLRDKN